MRQSRSEVVAVQQRCTELEAALATEKTWREEREQRQPDGESHGSARQLAAAKMVRQIYLPTANLFTDSRQRL